MVKTVEDIAKIAVPLIFLNVINLKAEDIYSEIS